MFRESLRPGRLPCVNVSADKSLFSARNTALCESTPGEPANEFIIPVEGPTQLLWVASQVTRQRFERDRDPLATQALL